MLSRASFRKHGFLYLNIGKGILFEFIYCDNGILYISELLIHLLALNVMFDIFYWINNIRLIGIIVLYYSEFYGIKYFN